MLIWLLKKFLKLVRHSLVLSSLFYLSLLISLLIYHLFYQWYMPIAKIEKNIDFELKTSLYSRSNQGIRDIPTGGSIYGQQYHHSTELVANLNLFDRPGESLHYGQEYSLALVLEVPESDWNFDLGMFGVTVEIVDIENRKIVTYKTMGTLVYKSVLLRYLTTLVNFPWYLMGRFEQKQTIALTLKENFIDNAYMPANKIAIRLSEKLQYYSAVLNIDAKFYGLKYYLNKWYYTCSLIICLGLTFITFFILLSSCFDLKSVFYTKQKDDNLYGSHIVPYKKLEYPLDFEFDKMDNDFETNSNFSARSMFEENNDDTESNASSTRAAAENTRGGFSLRKTYFSLKS